MESDTALSVAAEMVAELDITDQEVTKIADMIDGEIISLVPEWSTGLGLEESPDHTNCDYCQNCASSSPYVTHLSPSNSFAKNRQVRQCSTHGCAAMHGRFEEITCQFEASEQCVTEGAPVVSSQSDGMQYSDIWAQHDGPELSSRGSDDEHEQLEDSGLGKEEKVTNMDKAMNSFARESLSDHSPARDLAEDYGNEPRDQQLGAISRNTSFSSGADEKKEQKKDKLSWSISSSTPLVEEKNEVLLKSFASGKHFSLCFPIDAVKNCASQRIQKYDGRTYGAFSPDLMVTAKNFYTGVLLPQSLHRTTSLPVDAVEF